MDWITLQNTITLARLAVCLQESESLPDSVRHLLPLADAEDINAAREILNVEVDEVRARGEVVPWERLCQFCDYQPLAQDVLALALAAFCHPELYELYRSMGCREGVTIELALAFARREAEMSEISAPDITDTSGQRTSPSRGRDNLSELRFAYNRLEKLLYPGRQEEPFFRRPFILDQRIYTYLQGDNTTEELLAQFCPASFSAPVDTLWIHEAQADRLFSLLLQGAELIQVAGPQGVGKRHLVRHACSRTDMPLLEADASLLRTLEPAQLAAAVWRLGREMLLQESALCLYHVQTENSKNRHLDTSTLFRQLLMPVLDTGYPVFVCSDTATELIPVSSRLVERIELEELSRMERMALWEGWCALFDLQQPDPAILSTKFRLNAAQIQKAVQRVATLSKSLSAKEELTQQDISRECTLVLPSPTLGSLKRQKTTYTLEDLKLPAEQKQMLRNICAHITYRHQVYDLWNMEERYAYGKTVSALFVGPPGTGKTMAAHVLSDMLNLPLYTVDLSQVVDKYIGETEKRLEEIFSLAEMSSSILFFDEADAIFGKRSEVNDSKDRYANTEVAYILQRIEQYDGVVILSSNYQKNIDEAFMRRIRYLMEFQMPDESLRLELWKSCFSKETPLENVDFKFLAEHFELAGGAIKNIALNAAFLAADEGQPIGMSQLLRSLKTEAAKQGSNMLLRDFGPYAYMVR